MNVDPAPPGMSQSHRDSFNAAYSSLEQSIRNFSKEKLMLEQTIEGLRADINRQKDSYEKLTIEYQDLATENKCLLEQIERNQVEKAAYEATLAAVERRQDILSVAVEGFERIENDIISRYESHEDFVHSLKYRQVQLFEWIKENTAENNQLQQALEQERENVQSLLAELNDARLHAEKITQAFTWDKESLLKENETFRIESEKEIADLKTALDMMKEVNCEVEKQIHTLRMESEKEIADLKAALDTANEEKNQLQAALNGALTELSDARVHADQITGAFASEKDLLLKEIETRRTDSEKEIADLKAEVEKTKEGKIEALEAEKQKFDEVTKVFTLEKEDFLRQIEELKNQLQEVTNHAETLRVNAEKEVSDLKAEMENMKEISLKDLETARINAEKEVADLKAELEKTKETYMKEMETARINAEKEADDLKAELEKTKEASMKETETIRSNSEKAVADLKAVLDMTKEANFQALEFEKGKLDQLKSGFASEKEDFLQKISDLKTKLEEATNNAETLKTDSEKTIADLRAELAEKEAKLTEESNTLKNTLKEKTEECQKVSEEFYRCRSELRALYQRYQDQKAAISKLVEDSGVRPIILPTGSKSSSRGSVPSTPTRMTASPSPYTKVVPVTPSKPAIASLPALPPTPARSPRSILKRPNVEGDKGKNVSFGEITVNDFNVSSSSSSESSSPLKEKETPKKESAKRQKLSEDEDTFGEDGGSRDDEPSKTMKSTNDDDKEKENSAKESSKQRRYIRHRIGQRKTPAF